jgi:hypothetical protein
MAKRRPESELRRYAVVGAEQRLLQIAEEAATIFRAFPGLRTTGFMEEPVRARPVRRRSAMSPAARKAASARMTKYWADRRRKKGKKGTKGKTG